MAMASPPCNPYTANARPVSGTSCIGSFLSTVLDVADQRTYYRGKNRSKERSPIPDLERQVPKMGRCLCPEKCRGRGEEAGAEDGQVREGKASIHAMDGAVVPGARPAAGSARRQPKAAREWRLTYGLPRHYRCRLASRRAITPMPSANTSRKA
jgi:hypothetical protein